MQQDLVDAWPLVGRADLVSRALQRLIAGRGVVLWGEAGVGKTAVARAIADALDAGIEDESLDIRVTRVVASPSAGSSTLLGLVGQDGHRVVVFDDLHSLDDDAAALLRSLVREGAVTLLGTVRSSESVAESVSRMWLDDDVDRIDLEPLERDVVDELLDAGLRGPVEAVTRQQFWDLTHGSPLYLRELVRGALTDGSLTRVNGLWHLDGELRSRRLDELIGARLARVSDPARLVVEVVAAAEPMSFSGLLDRFGLDAVDEAESADLVEVVIDGARRDARLTHPLIGDVATRAMTASRGRVVGSHVLELVESTPMRRRDDVVRAATWQLRVGGAVVTDEMVLAARRALYGRDEWLAIELASTIAEPERADAALVLSEALCEVGEYRRAEALLARHGGDIGEIDMALVAIQRAVALYWGLNDAPAAERVLRHAEERIGEGGWHDEVLAERAVLAATQGRVDEALRLADPLLDRPENVRAYVTAAIAGEVARLLDGRCIEARELAERAYAMSAALVSEPGMSDSSIHLVTLALSMQEAGDLRGSAEASRAALAFATADGSRAGQGWFNIALAGALLHRGHLHAAREAFVESATNFAWLRSDGPRRWGLAGEVITAAMLGDVEGAERAMETLEGLPAHPARMREVDIGRARAWLAAAKGQTSLAIELMRDSIAEGLESGVRSLPGALMFDLIRLGDALDDEWLDVLDGIEGDLGRTRADVARGVAAGDGEALESAGQALSAMGADLGAATAAEAAAAIFAKQGDRRGQRRCLDAARAALAAAGLASVPAFALSEDLPNLTRREQEVAGLAARGLGNREIAESLVVSVRTVENHLQRVYEKLGVNDRASLAARLAR